MPRVSVVMPMYNGLPYIGEAIESIINQTFTDWELLVIDDGSTDGSPEIVKNYTAKDRRIKLLSNNSGVKGGGPARNIGIENAAGEYVARMDADDISLPQRLELQVAFMDKHPNIVLSGCYTKAFGRKNKIFWSFSSNLMIKALLLFHLEPIDGTIIFRRSKVNERYSPEPISEDTYFLVRVCLYHNVATLPKILYRYRMHPASITHTIDVIPYRRKALEKLMPLRFGFVPTPQQINTHIAWRWDMHEVEGMPVSMAQKLRWIWYVVTHAKIHWYERFIIAGWCMVYIALKRIDVMIFGK